MKTIPRVLLLITLAALCCVALIAQDKTAPAKPKSEAAGQAPAMPMPKPAPEMTKLMKTLSGNWTLAEKMEPGPMAPNGGTGKGTARFWAGPGGLSLIENYQSSGAMGGSFKGMGTFWWDPKAQVYRGVWCDNMTPNGCDTSGTTKWEGDNLVGTMTLDQSGQMMTMKFTYSDIKPDSFVMTMEMGPDAGKMQKFMTVTYTRAAGPAKM